MVPEPREDRRREEAAEEEQEEGQEEEEEGEEQVPAATVVKILAEINSMLQRTCTALSNYEAQLRQKAQGQATEKEIRDHLLQTFMQELKKFEAQIYKKYNTTQDAVKQSIGVLSDHAGISAQVSATKAIFAEVRKGNLMGAAGAGGLGGVGGGAPGMSVSLPDGFGRQEALGMLRKVMDHICVSIDSVAMEMRPDGSPVGNSPAALQEFNARFQKKTEAKAAELCKEGNNERGTCNRGMHHISTHSPFSLWLPNPNALGSHSCSPWLFQIA